MRRRPRCRPVCRPPRSPTSPTRSAASCARWSAWTVDAPRWSAHEHVERGWAAELEPVQLDAVTGRVVRMVVGIEADRGPSSDDPFDSDAHLLATEPLAETTMSTERERRVGAL